MIVTVNSQHFAQALRYVSKVVPAQPAIQILAYVLIEASPTEFRLSTTDLEVSLSLACPASVSAPGRCAISAGTLLQLIEQFNDGSIEILADATGAKMRHGTFSSRLQTMSAEEFPVLPSLEGQSAMLSGQALNHLVGLTRYAVAERGKKFVLEGSLLKLNGVSMGMIATDGARLSIATAARTEGMDLTAIIPRKTLDILSVLGDGDVELIIGSNHLFFTAGNMTLTSRVIEGKFPAYERIIPRDNDKTVIVERSRLASALRRVGVAAEKNCALYLTVGSNAMKVASKSVEVGEADEQIPAQYDGAQLTVCINWRYLLDFLNVAEGQTITITMKGEKGALLCSDGVSFINVIMTMRG